MNPFCINIVGLDKSVVQEMCDVINSACEYPSESATPAETPQTYTAWDSFNFLGVCSCQSRTLFHDYLSDYAANGVLTLVEPTIEALRQHLGLPEKGEEEECVKLRNVKLRITSEEQDRAFQEAVFESGGEWGGIGTTREYNVLSGVFPFIIVDDHGEILCDNDLNGGFDMYPQTEIEFTPTTTWKASIVAKKEEIFKLDGEYTREELLKILEDEGKS